MMDYIDLIGKPFSPGGRGPDNYDCYGLVKELYRRSGIELPEYAYDSPDNFSLIHRLINGDKDLFERLEKPEPYCLVLFTIQPPYISHIGVVLEDCHTFIHASEKVGFSRKLDHPAGAQIRGFQMENNTC